LKGVLGFVDIIQRAPARSPDQRAMPLHQRLASFTGRWITFTIIP